MGLHGASLSSNPYSTEIPARSSSLQSSLQPGANYGIYSSTTRPSFTNQFIGVPAFTNWSSAPPLLSTTTPSSRASSNAVPTLHSPLTAQVYSADPSSLRAQATLEMTESGPYALSRASPDQMIPECASAEPSRLYYFLGKTVWCKYFYRKCGFFLHAVLGLFRGVGGPIQFALNLVTRSPLAANSG